MRLAAITQNAVALRTFTLPARIILPPQITIAAFFMDRSPLSRPKTTTDCASRARDNKRRHRARRKEYVVDLERRLAETHEQGIQATKEVQRAAQKVTRENAKLKDLLRRAGYTDDAIGAWVSEDRRSHALTSETSGQKVTLALESHKEESEVSPVTACATACAPSSPSRPPNSITAPCQLLTLLAKDPAADITQVPLFKPDNQLSEPTETEDISDGVECSAAYRMLMHYATSDEKMDKIAASLESGCTLSAAGGCKVKNSVIWKALDDECT